MGSFWGSKIGPENPAGGGKSLSELAPEAQMYSGEPLQPQIAFLALFHAGNAKATFTIFTVFAFLAKIALFGGGGSGPGPPKSPFFSFRHISKKHAKKRHKI